MKEDIIIAKIDSVSFWTDKSLLIRFEYDSSKKNKPDYVRIPNQKIKEVLFASNLIYWFNNHYDKSNYIKLKGRDMTTIDGFMKGMTLAVKQFKIKGCDHYFYSFAGFAENKRFVIFEKIK